MASRTTGAEMTAVLVWILIVGEAGGHNEATLMGPFATQADCENVAASVVLSRFNRQCLNVKMLYPIVQK
jgi:hypothetical protein